MIVCSDNGTTNAFLEMDIPIKPPAIMDAGELAVFFS